MTIPKSATSLFLRMFPRPKGAGETTAAHTARVWSDINGLLQLFIIAFTVLYLFNPTRVGIITLVLFISYLMLVRAMVMRGHLRTSILSFSVVCGVLWQWIVWYTGVFQSTQGLLLCAGILAPLLIIGWRDALPILVLYCVMLVGNHFAIQSGAFHNYVPLRPTTQLLVAILVLAVVFVIALLVRNQLIEQYQAEASWRESIQKQLEDKNQQLEQLLHQVEGRADDLEKTVQSTTRMLTEQAHILRLNDLVAGVAHELSSPLGNAALMISTMHNHARELSTSEAKLPPRGNVLALRIEEGCDIVARNVKKIEELIGQFKKLSQEANEQVPVKVDVAKAVSESLLMSKPLLNANEVDVKVHVQKDLEIKTNAGAIHQILTNLIANAVKHGLTGMPSKQISIEATTSEEPGKPKMLLLTVKDNGRGIPKEVLPRIYEPFFTTARDAGGMGLGLGIVHNLVTVVLGGHISVQSHPGLTAFEIRIPLGT